MTEKEKSNLDHLLSIWKNDSTIVPNIVVWKTELEKPAIFEDFPDGLNPKLKTYFEKSGISSLYSHQKESWNNILKGKHIVITTGTSSGKTLCYALPILNSLTSNPDTSALLIFPTKSLTYDQFNNLSKAREGLNLKEGTVAIYDGDTPSHLRSNIRSTARLLLTNPDMLHIGILPHHTIWANFFQNLRFVVIDEIHIYRGVFGSHVANVLRRLRRIAEFYGSKPQFILTSATIANPGQLAEKMVEDSVVVIDRDGSPHSSRHFLILNPPVIQKDLGLRRSAAQEALRLADDLLTYEIQTILFTRTRRAVEITLRNLRNQHSDQSDSLHGYRSGYLPQERREIEGSLRNGDTRAVIATNALELGIDIGALGASILIGYPGSIAATRQQAGRAGRRKGSSLAVLIVSALPLDQYLVKHPEFLEKNPEQALINPDNLLILLHHLRCAAFELPFSCNEPFGKAPGNIVKGLLEFLVQEGALHFSENRYYWIADQYPSHNISLRSASENTVLLQITENGQKTTLGKVDQESSVWLVHPQAIYLHEGRMFQVENLDLENHTALLTPFESDYYTQHHSTVTVQKITEDQRDMICGGQKHFGEIMVTTQITGYRKLKWYTQENLGDYPLALPPGKMHTIAYWLCIDQLVVDRLKESGFWNNNPNIYGANWTIQKNLARKRDHYTCQVCGVVEQKQVHHVHHKTPFRSFTTYQEANKIENLITLCSACHQRAELVIRIRSGLAGLGYVLHNLAPLFLMCDVNDLGVYSDPQAPLGDNQPTIAIYDMVSAGIGLSHEVFHRHDELMKAAYELVINCDCQDGCPACVGPGGENGTGGKDVTIKLLSFLNLDINGK